MYFCSNQIVRTFGNWKATALSWLYNHTRSYTVGLAECSGKFVAAWNSVARLLSLPPVKLLTKLYFAQSVCSFVKPQFVKLWNMISKTAEANVQPRLIIIKCTFLYQPDLKRECCQPEVTMVLPWPGVTSFSFYSFLTQVCVLKHLA